ncbi:MAG: tape measure protein, partial [Chitinophagaceae bacterium]
MADSINLGIKITADGSNANATIATLNKNIESVGTSSKKAAAGVDSISRSAKTLSSAASAAGQALAAMGVAFSARELIRTADAYSGIVAKLKLVSGSTAEYATAQSKLFEISQRNMTPLAETVQLYSRLATSMRDLGRSQADTLAITDLVGKSIRISGADASSAAAGILQFSQAIGSGVLRGDEFNSMMENSPRLAKALADGLNVPIGALREMAAQGELTADKVVNAILSQSDAIKREYTQMPVTVSGAFQQIQNALTQYIGSADQSSGASRQFAETLSIIAANLNDILDPLAKVTNEVVKIELGGWLTFVDLIKEAKINLKEMAGLKDAGTVDPEVSKLMRYGSGQATIGEIAGPPPQTATAQKEFFDGVKRGANDAALAMSKLSDKQKAVAQIVIDTAKAYKVDPAFALAIAQQESGFNQLAKSAAGARGVMQLMPATAKGLGVNLNDLNDNIKGGVMYLAQQEKQFKSLRLAAAAYYAGPGAVQKYGGVPPYKETQNYVTSVGALYQKWQKVLGAQGEAFVSAKDQADELSNAFKQVQTHQDDNIKKADEYARVQVEKIKTQLAAMDQEREAAARLTAEQLAGAKTYQEKAKIIEAAQAKAAEYNAQALEMVRAEYDAQQQALETKKQAYQVELAQADKYNVSIDDQFKLKQAIRAADNDLLLLAENRAQAEITAAGKVNEFAKQSADLKRNEVTAIDGIIAAYQRQADILDRLTAAKQAGASADQLGLLNDYYQSTGNLPELVSQDQIERMQQYILSTQALKGAVDDLTGSRDRQRTAEQAVADEQLRLNAAYQNGVQQAQLFATQAAESFGEVGKSIGKLVVGVMQFSEQLYQIDRDRQNALKKINSEAESGVIDPAKQAEMTAKEQMKWADKSAQYQIAMMGNITDASKGFFKEGSKGYKAMEMATKAFRLFEMAMAVKSMITQLTANTTLAASDVTRTGTEVANSAARGQAKAAESLANQGSGGDPYSAFPRIAAMAAIMAVIGFAVAGASGSGSTTSRREDRQKTQCTGTVLGDSAAQSNSIANSLDIIRENSSNDLNYSAAMLRALEDLSLSILALANNVAVNVMPSIDAAIQQSGMKFGMSKISLFSGFNKELTDAGIGWFEQSLTDILNGTFDAKLYADITKSFEVMGSVLSSSTKTYVTGASAEVNTQITRIFTEIVKAFTEGGKAFGMSAENILGALEGFTLAQQQISLKDMTMEEQQQALNAVFSNITDQMAEALNQNLGLGLLPFQKAGEGMAQTFLRVSEGISRATGELERLGLTAISYRKVINTQGDVAAEITRQTLTSQKRLSDGVRQYINELVGKTDDIIAAYKQLIQASNLLKAAGIGDRNLDRTMINAAGGLSAFNDAMQAFNDNFISEADRYAGDVRVLAEQFGKLGYTLPSSKAGFLALVQGIDTSTEAGKKLFGQMIALSESFAQVANESENIRAKYANILDPFKAISDQINQVGTDFGKLVGGLTGDSQARIDAISNAASDARDPLTTASAKLMKRINRRFGGVAEIDAKIEFWQDKLDAELAKPPKKQNKQVIKTLQAKIARFSDFNDQLDAIDQKLAGITAQEGIDKAAESARLALEKQAIIDDARLAMGSTLEDIFNSLAQTIQQAQQRLQSVLDLQKSIASQLAQLQGPQAVLGLASTDRNAAFGAIDGYINSLSGGRARNVETEVGLLNTAQQAVMAKYNAEIAAIQEAEQAYIAAETDRLNAALEVQIEAINAATEAQIKAQSKLDQAGQKLLQKQFDQEQKALRKAHDAQLKALGDELDAANKLRDAIKGINDYVRGMALGGNSPLSPEQRLAEAQRQYQDLLTKAQGGDTEAMGRLTGASDAYLEASKQYYGSGTQYANTFDAVKNAMSAIGGMSAPDPDSIQARIDALRESQEAEMDALREMQSEKLDALRETQQDAINALRETAQKQIEALQKATQQSIADLSDPNKNAAMRAAREAAERDLAKLAELAELTRKEATKQAEQAKQKAQEQADAALKLANDQLEALQAGTRLSAQQLGVLSGILQGMGLQPVPIEGYAKGGYAQAGMALVGEKGPEIVRFERPAQVMTADETRDALSGGNNDKIVAAIAELKAEMRAVVVTQSNANPVIIDKLSG